MTPNDLDPTFGHIDCPNCGSCWTAGTCPVCGMTATDARNT